MFWGQLFNKCNLDRKDRDLENDQIWITSTLNGTTYHNVGYQQCSEQWVEEPKWRHMQVFCFFVFFKHPLLFMVFCYGHSSEQQYIILIVKSIFAFTSSSIHYQGIESRLWNGTSSKSGVSYLGAKKKNLIVTSLVHNEQYLPPLVVQNSNA